MSRSAKILTLIVLAIFFSLCAIAFIWVGAYLNNDSRYGMAVFLTVIIFILMAGGCLTAIGEVRKS